jgi:hypothetical protein
LLLLLKLSLPNQTSDQMTIPVCRVPYLS